MRVNRLKRMILTALAVVALLIPASTALAAGTTVPGHGTRFDSDENGFPDAGKMVNGHYTSVYAYDESGDWYQDLGDGRIRGTVGSIEDLDSETLTVCNYVNNYRADFGNDEFMNDGWIINNINCVGEEQGSYTYLIVSESDPRYTGNPVYAVWGTWEYHVLTISGSGNQVDRLTGPESHVQ